MIEVLTTYENFLNLFFGDTEKAIAFSLEVLFRFAVILNVSVFQALKTSRDNLSLTNFY